MLNQKAQMSYADAKVYEITGGGKRYVGSTIQSIERRLQKHQSNKRLYEKGEGPWTACYELLDYPDCEIHLLEAYPCAGRDELRLREKHFITTLACVNKVIPARTQREWLDANPDKVKASYERRKAKRVVCPCCSKEVSASNYARHKKGCS